MSPTRYQSQKIRNSTVLTNSYAALDIISDVNVNNPGYVYVSELEKSNQLELDFIYTKGSLTSLKFKIEYSINNIDWVTQTNKKITDTGTELLTNEYVYNGTDNFQLSLPICTKYIKISVIGIGTVTGSLLSVNAKIAWK